MCGAALIPFLFGSECRQEGEWAQNWDGAQERSGGWLDTYTDRSEVARQASRSLVRLQQGQRDFCEKKRIGQLQPGEQELSALAARTKGLNEHTSPTSVRRTVISSVISISKTLPWSKRPIRNPRRWRWRRRWSFCCITWSLHGLAHVIQCPFLTNATDAVSQTNSALSIVPPINCDVRALLLSMML